MGTWWFSYSWLFSRGVISSQVKQQITLKADHYSAIFCRICGNFATPFTYKKADAGLNARELIPTHLIRSVFFDKATINETNHHSHLFRPRSPQMTKLKTLFCNALTPPKARGRFPDVFFCREMLVSLYLFSPITLHCWSPSSQCISEMFQEFRLRTAIL